MTTSQPDGRTRTADRPPTLRRRGLFAAALGFVAGFAARWSEEPLEAGSDGDVVLGGDNVTTTATKVTNTAGGTTIFANSPHGIGVWGYASDYGVFGTVVGQGLEGGAAVCGQSLRADSYGVQGINVFAGGIAVNGLADVGTGVLGQVTSGNGVMGQIPGSAATSAIAVYGQNYSSYAGPSPGAGGFGVYGISAKGHGLVGAVATAGAAAVVGAVNGVSGAYAAAFYGPVVVGGNFTVVGGAKSAAVPHPDGTHRRLYCVESPESWFEDFGMGRLQCGQSEIAIDPDFAAVALLDDYHVFLTGYDGQFDLCVSHRTPTGFRVQAKSGAADGAFSWRIVAKRKDIPAPRFETVSVPAEPVLPRTMPDPPPPVFDVRESKTVTRR
jgi:hypothetical protein